MAVPLIGSVIYFNYLPWTQLSIPAVAVAAAVLSGWGLSRRAGGLRRRTLLAVNILTQLAFLGAYVANR